MREVNFSIPSVNKAAVSITTTLYDRRALDCTSTLPLINSLNHLAYLTTSSARIRDILTVDGGIERLVCILKEGRSKDLMEMWKWNLAFQCIVNIGVRGSENVRTRVVEADMVPDHTTSCNGCSSMDTTDGFGLRPVRDADRLPSQVPGLQNGLTSQPDSPTTPHTAVEAQSIPQFTPRARRRPSVRQQRSTSGESDDGNTEDVVMGDDSAEPNVTESIVGLQAGMEIESVTDQDAIMNDGTDSHGIALPNPSEQADAETFNITHRSVPDGSLMNPAAQQANAVATATPAANQIPYPYYLRDRTVPNAVLAAMPRDEDPMFPNTVACGSYFQNTHLVPKLKIGKDIHLVDDPSGLLVPPTEPTEETEEYLLPDDFNIFPLVEKFTVRHHTKEMQYWACVVMRNLCRKDDSRGGIRQCAYYKCGKWEEFQRQFAKCRRCRRTKYCSKECQKNAWVYHRHWCHSSP
ncbi:MYND-type zinc finger protein MUB1 [Coccidioides immitis H538.4]|uniref:MYND-type zinc finger protein samB n=1 Tax=Coccidioides immitis H538.4 TaxID=396776 RepID=A0A0J8RT63_COCIT|nr:MYND-type zinc finger protein MUB1 [Coccidioides immitis H538.4]